MVSEIRFLQSVPSQTFFNSGKGLLKDLQERQWPVVEPPTSPRSSECVAATGNKVADPAANTGAVTLIQRLGSAANLNIHLHCVVLDGDYRNSTAV